MLLERRAENVRTLFEIVEHEYICQCADRGCGAGALSAEEIAEVDSLYLVDAGWNPAAVPVSIETTFSLAPNAQVVSIEAGAVTSQVLAEMPALDNTANRYLEKYYFEGITVPEQETAQNPMNLIASIWLCGVAVLLVYAAVSYIHIRRKVRESVRIEGNIYICDRIQTPFIFGVLNPRIYLPSSLKEVQIKNVVAHEKAHIRRLDYLWKPLGYVLFAVYWFNPFCWLAYILFCRDIEMACDERVIKDWSAEQKKEYSLVLLSFHVPGKMITVCPLAFGEVGVKQRVKGILNFKKPTFWLIAAALLFCVIIGALFLTNPKKNDNVEENIATELSESSPMRFGHNNKVSYKPGRMHFVTGTEQRLTVCAWMEQEKK